MHTMSVLTYWSQTEAKTQSNFGVYMDTKGTGSSVRTTWITEEVRASELEHGGS